MHHLKASPLHFRKLIPLIFIGFCVTFFSPAQTVFEQIGRLPVTTYSAEEYGGDPLVWAAIQSEEGLMYFGTRNGLHEYDGVSWRSLFRNNEVFAIRSFTKDATGRIFYAGHDFGYLEVDTNGETQAVSLLHLIPEEFKTGFLIWEIHFLNGYILLRNQNKQIIRMELAEDWTLKSLKSWQAETIFGISFVVGNEYYVRQVEKGLYRLEDEELQLIPNTEIFRTAPLSIMVSHLGGNGQSILMGAQTTGFYLFNDGLLTKFPTQVDQLIKDGARLYSAILHQGNYILGFIGGGIVTINKHGEILKSIGTDQGLPSDVVTSVYLDENEGLWATTEDGMARIAIDSPILSFGKDSGINSSVLTIEKNGEDLFLGTNTGLMKFDQKNKIFQSVPEINNVQIFDIESEGEDLIVPGRNLQVLRDGKEIMLDGPKDATVFNSVAILKSNPNLLLVSSSNGLLVYERGLSKDFPWELKGKVPGVGVLGSVPIFEGKDGTIFTTGSGKLYALGIKEGGLESKGPESIKSKVFEISSSDTYSLVDGEFYIKTSAGMQKFSEKEQDFLPTDDFKAVESEIMDISQHKSGVTWYESQAGKKFVLKRNEEGKFVKDERPNSIAPYLNTADFIDEDSILWFGTPKGLIRYDPKKDKHTEKEFFTLLRRIETKTDTLPLIAYGRDKTLPAVEMKANSYRFEFAAPYFEDEKKTKYQTYLEGFDADWVDWNDNKFKEYTNLPVGSYTFRVRAQAFTGRVSEEASYSFVVLPPWYATWWAYLIYALLVFGLISAIVKWRSQKLKAENLILEEKVKERTAELEQSYHNVELLGEIGRKITASLSAEKIISTVYANVNALMEASILGIGIYQEETQTLDFPSTYENGAPLAPYSNSLQDPNRLAALCFNTGNEIVINDLNAEYGRYLQQMPTPSGGEVPVSLIYLPLKVKGKLFGVITVQSFSKNAFSEYHLYMLRTIAVYTAIALENAESFQNLQDTLSSLKATQSQLIQSEKMASLGELTAGIAHEIQNPLNFVNNFSEVSNELIEEMKEEFIKGETEEGFAIADDIKQNLEKIAYHGKRADSIVKGMLQHSRTGSIQKEPTDINTLADEYLRLAYHGLRAKDKSFQSDYKTDLDPNLPLVEVMPQDISRVLLNLINNAFYAVNEKRIKHLNNGNEAYKPMVTVKTKVIKFPSESVPNLREDKWVEISVSDNGDGIPESVKSKIFQPFFTTKPTGQGTGLGLSLSYDIIKAHGGEISVESLPDGEAGLSADRQGTEFNIKLPLG